MPEKFELYEVYKKEVPISSKKNFEYKGKIHGKGVPLLSYEEWLEIRKEKDVNDKFYEEKEDDFKKW